jgi:hypothetical protein
MACEAQTEDHGQYYPSHEAHDAQRGEYERLEQDYGEDWAYEAAKIYLQAWVVSWHQQHNEDAKDVARWSHEDLEVIAAKQT